MPATMEPEEPLDIADPTEKLLAAIGQRIRETRQAMKLTQRQLAEKVGLGQSYITALENGAQNPTVETLVKFATALAVNVRDLFPISQGELPTGQALREFEVALSGLRPIIQACAEQGDALKEKYDAAADAFAQLSKIQKAVDEMTQLMTRSLALGPEGKA